MSFALPPEHCPVIGPLNSVTWFGVISLIGSGLGILASQLLIARMEKKGTVSRTSAVSYTHLIFQMGGMYGSMSYLQITASDLSDQLLKDFLDMESSQIVNMHIQSVDQNKACLLYTSRCV